MKTFDPSSVRIEMKPTVVGIPPGAGVRVLCFGKMPDTNRFVLLVKSRKHDWTLDDLCLLIGPLAGLKEEVVRNSQWVLSNKDSNPVAVSLTTDRGVFVIPTHASKLKPVLDGKELVAYG